jgi:putative DNA primase/helicase
MSGGDSQRWRVAFLLPKIWKCKLGMVEMSDPNWISVLYEYAANGWYLFPVGRDKKPFTNHGFKDATQTQGGINECLRKYPNCNWAGYFTGQLIIDVDPRHGGSLESLEARTGKLPKTRTHKTGGGGLHLLFKQPHGFDIRNTVEFVGLSGIDRRGNGGYIVLPPSVHESGSFYEVFDESPIAEAPATLLILSNSNIRAHQMEPMREVINEGARNSTLASIAGSLHHRGIPQSIVEQVLLDINRLFCKPLLPDSDVIAIARSINRYSVLRVRGGAQL